MNVGTEQRSKAKTLELIQNLHDNAAPIPFIAEVIGLPVEEVQTIIRRRKEIRTKKVPVTDRYLKSHPYFTTVTGQFTCFITL